MPYVQNAFFFLLDSLSSIALYLVLLRFWMQWVRADFRNPLGQVIIKATNPAVIPLRKIIPPVKTIDSATLVLAYLVALAKLYILSLVFAQVPSPVTALIVALGFLLRATILLLGICMLISIIASWVARGSYHPVLSIASSLADVILAPIRRVIPPIGGIDISPLFGFLLLRFAWELLVNPLLSGGF